MKLNTIPSPTWRWLKMNETSVDEVTLPANNKKSKTKQNAMKRIEKMQTGLGVDAAQFFSCGTISAIIGENAKLKYELSGTKNTAETVVISVPDGKSVTVIMTVTSGGSGYFGLRSICGVGKDGFLNLVQVFMPGTGGHVFNDIGGAVDDGGNFKLQQIFLDGKETLAGAYVSLYGRHSEFACDIAYRTVADGSLDMNYVVEHTGVKSRSLITANGVLRDNAEKLFRGTIDFKNGCAGAIGSETEDVLLMDDTVHNRSIPVILCAEEDVEGNHGATIGKLDEELMFYLMSRGMAREDIYEMMAVARIDALRRDIADEETKSLVASALGL